jgi:hypothetical protein
MGGKGTGTGSVVQVAVDRKTVRSVDEALPRSCSWVPSLCYGVWLPHPVNIGHFVRLPTRHEPCDTFGQTMGNYLRFS